MRYKSIPTLKPEQIERFWSKVDTSAGPDGCWLWFGHIQPDGYGRIGINFDTFAVHRVAYTILVGEIDGNLALDHVVSRGCTHRNCVNPAHLEPITVGENVLRGRARAALNAKKDRCHRGHLFTTENTYVFPRTGMRRCRTCHRDHQAKYALAKKAS